MASSTVKKDDDDARQQRAAAPGIHDQFQWNDSSDDEKDDGDNHEFFDAHDTDFHPNQSPTTESNTEADLLHNRLNTQLSTSEETKKKTPGKSNLIIPYRVFSLSLPFLEDPYFIDEELLVEREALLTEEDKEVCAVVLTPFTLIDLFSCV